MQFQFNDHSKLGGSHAAFSPSQPHWLRYDDEKVVNSYNNKRAAEMGTILHAWAQQTIDLGIKQPRSNKTLYAYVNDVIGYRMSTEVVLYYSPRIYGTADAISFKNNILRISDLKTGTTPAKMDQLYIYAALFCLEYRIDPKNIKIELRLYQNDKVKEEFPTADEIIPIMEHIAHVDKIAEEIDAGGIV